MPRVCSTPRACEGAPHLLLLLKYAKTVLRNLILPPTGPLLLAIIGLLLLRRRPRLARGLLALGLGSLWLLSLPFVADALTRLTEHYPPLDLAQPTQAQAIVILGGGALDGVVIRVDGLDQHDSGSLAAAGASAGLGEQLEGALGGAEIGEAEADVGAYDAH